MLSTIASYRDALRVLILFAAERTQRKPCALAVADLDRDLVLAFLDELEQTRKNTIQTRNARLAATVVLPPPWQPTTLPRLRHPPQRILAIPVKRSHTEVTHHLARQERHLHQARISELLAGRRDRRCCFFLGRTGARVSSARRRRARSSARSDAAAGAPARQGRKEQIIADYPGAGQSTEGAHARARPRGTRAAAALRRHS